MHNHAVYFYEDDTFLIDNVVHFVKQGLEQQESVIIVATDLHREELKARLMETAMIGLWASKAVNYVTLDTSDTLQVFMRDGWPDEDLFLKVIGRMIESIARNNSVRIYGEMVAVLWAEGNPLAAIQLERLWNTLAKQRNFSLLCGYPSSAFQEPDMNFAFQDICACHSKIDGTDMRLVRPL
jgi:KaiC/GvpD/RAD55 family RecA-like ATPase